MARKFEDFFPPVKEDGIVTDKTVKVLQSSSAVAGGTLAFDLGVLAIYVGSGAPTVSATKGSLYLRTDGSSTSTRLYVNNGTTNWVAVTTAS